jgi:nicotinate-nucleotide adenylyltransferase
MQIGLFGGTFNPVHQCHLVVAEQVRQRLGLDQIVFVPAGDPPHKSEETILDSKHRLEMIRLAIQPFREFSVSEVEVKRPGKSYAVDTLEKLTASDYDGDHLFFMLGLDAFLEIGTWKNPEKLFSLCHFIVLSRKGFKFKDVIQVPLIPQVPEETLHQLDLQKMTQVDIPLSSGKQVHLLYVPHCEASSTQIRILLSRGKQTKNLLPHSVESYIIKNKLYQPLEAKP